MRVFVCVHAEEWLRVSGSVWVCPGLATSLCCVAVAVPACQRAGVQSACHVTVRLFLSFGFSSFAREVHAARLAWCPHCGPVFLGAHNACQ